MRNGVIRIAVWASAGALVSVGWGLYFASGDKRIPTDPIVYSLAKLTQPVAALVWYLKPAFPIGLNWVVAANAVTYAVLGLIAMTIKKHHHISS